MLGDACDPGFGYDMVRLSALVAERCDPVQTGLAGGDHAEELAHLIDRLGARFGLRRVTRLVPQDTHIPEYAVAAVPAHAIKQIAVRADRRREQDSLGAVRPIRLFERPESIEAVAQVPDGPPVRFAGGMIRCIRSSVSKVPSASPWNGGATIGARSSTRDYFRVESETGAARLALSRGTLRAMRQACAALVSAWTCLHERQCRFDFFRASAAREPAKISLMPNWPSPPIFPFCVVRPIPRSLSSEQEI